MRIQSALDLLDPQQAIEVTTAVAAEVDIIEVGTSLLKLGGEKIVEELRISAQGRPLFVDAKIIDGPLREAALMARVGAEYYSMLAVATDTAVCAVLDVASEDATVVFDLQSVPDPVNRAIKLEKLGARAVCVHKNSDCGDDLSTGFAEVERIKASTELEVFIAGGISATGLAEIAKTTRADVAIIGGAILHAEDPAEAARSFRRSIRPDST